MFKEEPLHKDPNNLIFKTNLGITKIETFADKMEYLDKFLETEKIQNKNDSWNKLDKTMKLQKCWAIWMVKTFGKLNLDAQFTSPKYFEILHSTHKPEIF